MTPTSEMWKELHSKAYISTAIRTFTPPEHSFFSLPKPKPLWFWAMPEDGYFYVVVSRNEAWRHTSAMAGLDENGNILPPPVGATINHSPVSWWKNRVRQTDTSE